MKTIKENILDFIEERGDQAFLRQEFNGMGSRSAVSSALQTLVGEAQLFRIGYGVYAPAQNGRARYKLSESVMDALKKLGTEPSYGGRAWREWQEGKTTQIPAKPTVTVRKRITRALGRGNTTYRYEYALKGKTGPRR